MVGNSLLTVHESRFILLTEKCLNSQHKYSHEVIKRVSVRGLVVGCDGKNRIKLFQNHIQWRTLVKAMLNFQIRLPQY